MKKQPEQPNKHTRYPIVLVHGIVLKDIAFFKAFGRIEKTLKRLGYTVFTAKTDGFGTIENNAEQLSRFVDDVLKREKTEKVNLIAHSKGGLDGRYYIDNLGGDKTVASLTTLCTPHKGSPIASELLRLPKPIMKFIAFWINLVYRIFGDKHPNSLKVCEQLKLSDATDIRFSPKVYCQSYSMTMQRSRDDFIMGIPHMFSKRMEQLPSDGLVSNESAQFGEYKGSLDGSISHSEIVDFMASKRKKERIYAFYSRLCEDLYEMGF